MIEYELSPSLTKKYNDYLNSETYKSSSTYSKSAYWHDHASKIHVECLFKKISIEGQSGNYIPNQVGMKRLQDLFYKALKSPSLVIPRLRQKLGLEKLDIKLLSHNDAFNRVMWHDPLSDPDLSPFRLNFKKLSESEKFFSSDKELSEKYFARHKYSITPSVVCSYYYANILMSKTPLKRLKTVLEIGSGNGNLLALLSHLTDKTTMIDIDLPETISLSIPFIADLFPKAKILFPHEAAGKKFEEYDFVFLTPSQINLIKDQSIDLSVNINSFQEMTHTQIDEYFKLIQRVGKQDSLFFTSNRVEKIPCGPDSFNQIQKDPPNRFSDYPWNIKNDVLIYEVCRLMRLVSLDNHYIRMEQIKN
tara:strand:+ start:124 stop:1209 length:1086 start_codon:yes stop_codon:yes gene_type:complete